MPHSHQGTVMSIIFDLVYVFFKVAMEIFTFVHFKRVYLIAQFFILSQVSDIWNTLLENPLSNPLVCHVVNILFNFFYGTRPFGWFISDPFSSSQVLGEIQEIVKTGLWVGDCFIYTSSVNRLNYYVGGEIVTIAHLDR